MYVFLPALAAVIALLWVSARALRARARRAACARCGYDMSASAGLRCPECGTLHAHASHLFAPARRVRLGAGAIIGALIIAVCAGFWHARWDALYALLPTWQRVDTSVAPGVRIVRERLRDHRERGERVRIIGPRGEVVLADSAADVFRQETGVRPRALVEDFTGDGVPDVLVWTFSGGAHCCTTISLVSLGGSPAVMDSFDAQSAGAVLGTGRGAVRSLITRDGVWDYWNAPYVASARVAVTLSLRGGRLVMDADAMRRPPPSEEDVRAQAARLRAGLGEGGPPDARVWEGALEHVYSGNWRSGRALFDLCWKEEWGDGAAFWRTLVENLSLSRHWEQIRGMNPGLVREE